MRRLLGLLALALLAFPAAASAISRYSTAKYTLRTHPYAFGQAPVFMPGGRVVFGKDFRDGKGMQVYITRKDGSGRRCLTCDMPARFRNGANSMAQAMPRK